MLNNIRNWFVRNQDAITWFIIGYLVNAAIDSLGQREYTYAAILLVIAYGNYLMRKVRMQ